MTQISRDLVATCWTSAGDVLPGAESERSRYFALDRVGVAADNGFMGLGFVHDDLVSVRDGVGFDALKRFADRAGIRHLEVELAGDWWLDPQTTPWRAKWELLLEAAKALNSPFIKIGTAFGAAAGSVEPFVDPLRRLADEAAAIGTRVALEPLPFALIASMPQGAELMRAADHEHAGLVVDYWHVFRAGTSLDELEKTLSADIVFGVELDDADAEPEPGRSLFEDTRDNRRYPGEGAFDVVGFIRTMARIGFDGPWGVEMLSNEHRALPLGEALHRAYRAGLWCVRHAELAAESDGAADAPIPN
jgi:sugar phosphate isomerase/epimerase